MDKNCEAPPVSDIEGALNRQSDLLDILHKEISMLEDRLIPVLRSALPVPGGEAGTTENKLSSGAPMCESLEGHNEQLRVARARISRLLERLAVRCDPGAGQSPQGEDQRACGDGEDVGPCEDELHIERPSPQVGAQSARS